MLNISKLFKTLYFQVLLAITVGVLLGHFQAPLAIQFKPIADGFISIIRMLIGPVIFLAIVSGILSVDNLSKARQIGLYAIIYFLVMTGMALLIGLTVSTIFTPGSGFNADLSTLDISQISAYTQSNTTHTSLTEFLMHIIPKTFFSAFSEGDILQILFVAILFAIALGLLQTDKVVLLAPIQSLSRVFSKMIAIVLKLAPLGAFAAMAFAVGKFGLSVLSDLFLLLACFYLTCLVFIFVILGSILRYSCGVSMWRLLAYLHEELLIVFSTSSSESVLPRLMEKLEALGAEADVVRLVVPTGYSFNLDGTAIYLSLAALFIAQATHVHLNGGQILVLLGLMIVSSKGAAAVAGGGFIILAATLSAFQIIPVYGIVLILGIDRFMSEGRAITNVIGNSVAALFLAKTLGHLDQQGLQLKLRAAKSM